MQVYAAALAKGKVSKLLSPEGESEWVYLAYKTLEEGKRVDKEGYFI